MLHLNVGLDVQIPHRINENFDLVIALEEKSRDHQSDQDSSASIPPMVKRYFSLAQLVVPTKRQTDRQIDSQNDIAIRRVI